MAKHLVVVESPAKAKTIKKYLGKDFEVLASYGHVRDLVPKEGAVDPEHNFAMKYDIIEKNAKHVAAISKALKQADTLYLATDPDREGEAISWHIHELMKAQKGLAKKPTFRIVFHEITQSAITQAVEKPREISMDLVNAQQARRALDYLVGFNLSPLLWRKVRPGLSAGRVQSPALRLIAERETEIEQFITQEYWTIEAEASSKKQNFPTKLSEYKGEKLKQFSITTEKEAKAIEKVLLKAGKDGLIVTKVEKKQRKSNPSPPFITSTLQQEAARKLGFTTDRAMRTAQQLYEGISIGKEGSVGLITYMRTDSVSLAQEATQSIREYISERYGKENIPDEARIYKTKSKNAQEAHEAIRPTDVSITPESIKDALSPEQFKLYDLIWKRTVACQMVPAIIDTMSVDLSCGEGNKFRSSGSVIVHPGYMAVYQEDIDDPKKGEDDGDHRLPPMKEGDKIDLLSLAGVQHFTEPPPRFSEASLVKALEEHDIGRPSTYSSIIYTLKHREYVTLDQKRFRPTDIGRIVNKFLTQYFTQYVDYDFTARLEDQLDAIARGEEAWVPMLDTFWSPFIHLVKETQETVKRSDVTQEKMDEACPKCGKPLSIRLGKRGRFVGCTAYPECDYTRNMDGEETPAEPEVVEGRTCPECESPLVIKFGRYGKFIGCSNYPKCKHMEPLEKPADTGVECPECKQATLLKRKSRFGKIFYSCARYPDCKYAIWNEPLKEPCPKCNWPLLTLKTTKRRGTEKACPQKTCGYTEPVEA